MKPIRILSKELNLLGEVDNYLSFSFTRKYYTYGEFQLVTNIKIQNADKLNIGNILMVGNDKFKVGLIRHKEIKINEVGEEMLTVKGYSLSHFLTQRITLPPEGVVQDTIEGNAEAVMKHYVKRNCLDIEVMEFPNFIISKNQNRGGNIKWSSRYKNLAEELEKISRLTDIDFTIYPDFESKTYVFDVYDGRNFSANQDINPPVIFSSKFDNVKSQEYVDSLIDYGNYAIVAGPGEGVDREIIMMGSETASGFEKSVILVDARDLEDSNDLPARGNMKLQEHKRVTSFSTEVLPTGPFKYQVDWDLGDIVTVQNKEWDVEVDTRITEITEIYEAGGFRLGVVFGEGPLTLGEKIKREIAGI
ncbi:MAG TPA: siphovirus ReqiPepy6 Gp37-like family protein [Tissierellaceae bacterium]|nr:siphovirus ReqiPepy6 Gp37-like family protein [Tissierellaceae bacterium]